MSPPDISPPDATPRSKRIWLALIVVWTLGVVSWMLYISLGAVILYRVL
jgi:hypothetical protein